MTKFARLDANGYVIESCDAAALATHEPILRGEFVPCPDVVNQGSRLVGNVWQAPVPVEPPIQMYPLIPPPQFYWLFTIEEQLSIETFKQTDDMIKLFFKRLDDPRLQAVDLNLASVQEAIKYTLNKCHVSGFDGRFAEIMTGVLR